MPPRAFATSAGAALAFALVLALDAPALARPRDPAISLLHRMHLYFASHETDGVTLDSRSAILPTEVIRLTVVSELLGYIELEKVHPCLEFRRDIVRHADYLLLHFDEIVTGGPFDGMLGYALLGAYEISGDSRYLERGTVVVNALKALPSYDTILNGGLMAALALAEYDRLVGDPESALRTHDIVASQVPYQHTDGSFPHWCQCSKDVSYTDWMAMEMILIQRMTGDPLIEPMLEGAWRFMEARLDSTGNTRYEEPCPGVPDCTLYYYSIATGCTIDYDTRAFTNEPGYTALLFDHFHSLRSPLVMRFLLSLETRGTFKDKWDFWPPPSDPYYVWTTADTSVVNMGVIFWSLAALLSGRPDLRAVEREWLAEEAEDRAAGARAVAGGGPAGAPRGPLLPSRVAAPGPPSARALVDRLMMAGISAASYCDAPAAPRGSGPAGPDSGRPGARLGPVVPNPVRDRCAIRLALSAPASVSLTVLDARGRAVRRLISGSLEAGERVAWWDGRDGRGRPLPAGAYFVQLRAAGEERSARIVILR